jgi:excisionase family DNA binding protein
MNKERVKDEPMLLRAAEVAELLGISRAKAYRLMQRRELPVVTFGKSVRVPREPLLDFIRAATQPPANPAAA